MLISFVFSIGFFHIAVNRRACRLACLFALKSPWALKSTYLGVRRLPDHNCVHHCEQLILQNLIPHRCFFIKRKYAFSPHFFALYFATWVSITDKRPQRMSPAEIEFTIPSFIEMNKIC